MRRNSPSIFLGTNPRGEMRNTRKGGDEKGPASLWASSSFEILASTAVGFCMADSKLLEVQEKRGPS